MDALEQKLCMAKKNNLLPKIVIPVHFAGQSCDMKRINELSNIYGFKVIEDASHAIGGKYLNQPIGNCKYSDITVFSFHPVKIITTGEGGAVLSKSSKLNKKLKILRGHGITKDKNDFKDSNKPNWYYEQQMLGYNYFLTDFQSALGSSQLQRINIFIKKRHQIHKWYEQNLNFKGYKSIIQKNDRKSSLHLYIINFNNGSVIRNRIYNFHI